MADEADDADNRTADGKLKRLFAAEFALEYSAEAETAESDQVIRKSNNEISGKACNIGEILVAHHHFKQSKNRACGKTLFDAVTV